MSADSYILAIGLATLAFVPASAAQETGRVSGRVVESKGGAPLARVRLRLTGERHVVSDSVGFFSFSALPAGGYRLEASVDGFKTVSLWFILGAGDHVEMDVEMAKEPIRRLPEVVVEEETTRLDAKLRGFYERQQRGMGTFVTPRQLSTHRPGQLTGALRWIPGLRVDCRNIAAATCEVTFERSNPEAGRFGCPVVLFIDGVRHGTVRGDIDALVPMNQLGAIEAYRGIGHLPREYSGAGTQCGVVALWLKPPGDES